MGKMAQLYLFIRQQKDTMNKAQLRALVSKYVGERLDEWEDATYSAAGMEALKHGGEWQDSLSGFAQSSVEDCVEALRSNDVAAIASLVDEFVSRYSLDLAKDSPQYQTLARELLKAETTIAKEIKQRVQGEYGDDQWGVETPRPNGGIGVAAAAEAISALASSLPPASTPEPAAGMLLSEAMKAYQAHYAHMAPGTITAKRVVFSRFLEIVGDKPVKSIGKKDAIAYRDTLALLPAEATQRYPGLSIRDVIEKTKDQPHLQRISKRTINQDLIHMNALFTYLMDEEILTQAHTPVRRIAFKGTAGESYPPFTDEDIQRIFGSDTFRAQKTDPQYIARHWLLLILLYTGARREEIADLALTDIKRETEDGAGPYDFFDLTFDEARGRRLKNKGSKRRVPIHSHLIELGLLRYVEARRAKGERLLFSGSRKAGPGSVGDSVGKWFFRLLVALDIKKDTKKCVHSLRDTMVNKLTEVGVGDDINRKLVGHAGMDVHGRKYVQPKLKVLRDSLEKVDFRPLLKGLD
jgi:integrase